MPLALKLFSKAPGLEQMQGSSSRVINAIIVCALVPHGQPPAQGGLCFSEFSHWRFAGAEAFMNEKIEDRGLGMGFKLRN